MQAIIVTCPLLSCQPISIATLGYIDIISIEIIEPPGPIVPPIPPVVGSPGVNLAGTYGFPGFISRDRYVRIKFKYKGDIYTQDRIANQFMAVTIKDLEVQIIDDVPFITLKSIEKKNDR